MGLRMWGLVWVGMVACNGDPLQTDTGTTSETTDTDLPTEDTAPTTITDTGEFPVSGDLEGTWETQVVGKTYAVTITWEAGPSSTECFLTTDFGDGSPFREPCGYSDDGTTLLFGDTTCPYAGVYDFTVVPKTSLDLTLVKDPTCPGREVVFENVWTWIGPWQP